MVQSAATLIRERGIHGTGLREVVAHSGGPRGSLGRFFPGGKTQLVTEAIDVALVDLFGDLERDAQRSRDVPRSNQRDRGPMAAPARRPRLRLGLPPGRDHLRRGRQRQPPHPCQRDVRVVAGAVADAYTRFGAPPAEAEAHATVLMAALEGALILARAQRNIEPLDTVERFFASRAPDPRRA